MSKKRRMFDIDLPDPAEVPAAAPDGPDAPVRRGPMATAIGENAEALRQRAGIEAEIRAENDALAHEFVRLRRLGLTVELIPLDKVHASRLTRDRALTADLALDDLVQSIREIGLSNPIRVVPDGDGGYELVQGLRRLSAYRALLAETGEARYATIPAGMMAPGDTLETLYRRMVDENLIRKDVSFAEMAILARAYADDGVEGCDSFNDAVNLLFASASPQKRSYIRRFGFLMRVLEKHLNHAPAMPRALGLAVADRIEGNADALAALTARLRAAGPRDARTEIEILRAFVAQDHTPPALGPAAPEAKRRGAPKGERRGRMTLVVPVGQGVRATATAGKVELRADMDFSTLDRRRLEAAIEAFFAALERS